MKNIDLLIANPAGNTTIFVLSPSQRSEYQEIAGKLLERDYAEHCSWADSVYGEQVAFVLPAKEDEGKASMEMCGLEFCGNASRAFAYYLVSQKNDQSPAVQEISVNVSGCDYPLKAKVNIEANEAMIQMPVPSDIDFICLGDLGLNEHNEKPQLDEAVLVNMDGIAHLVLKDVEASPERFEQLRDYVYSNISSELPAFGVMFIDTKKETMTPVVYVKDVDTTYFEGSCASGTTAASCAMAMSADDGEYDYTFVQPSGTLYTHVAKREGKIHGIELTGLVEISEAFTLEI